MDQGEVSLGIWFIICGLLFVTKPLMEWNIRMTNKMRGRQIDEQALKKYTLPLYRIFGIVVIALGVYLVGGQYLK